MPLDEVFPDIEEERRNNEDTGLSGSSQLIKLDDVTNGSNAGREDRAERTFEEGATPTVIGQFKSN